MDQTLTRDILVPMVQQEMRGVSSAASQEATSMNCIMRLWKGHGRIHSVRPEILKAWLEEVEFTTRMHQRLIRLRPQHVASRVVLDPDHVFGKWFRAFFRLGYTDSDRIGAMLAKHICAPPLAQQARH